MFLFGEPKRSSTAAVAPKTNATLSLPSLWLRLTFSLHDRSTRRSTRSPRKTLLFLELLLALKHRSRFLPLKKRFEYHTLTLFFKMKHQMVPHYLSSLVPAPTSESSRHCFRKLSYPVPLVSKTSTLNSFLPRAIILWNSLPAAFQDIKTLARFKFQLKSFLKNN